VVLDARATLVGCGDGGVSNGLRLDVGLSPECSIIGLRVNVACDPWGIIGGRGGLDASLVHLENRVYSSLIFLFWIFPVKFRPHCWLLMLRSVEGTAETPPGGGRKAQGSQLAL